MSHLHNQMSPPSWSVPILLGAAFVVLVQGLLQVAVGDAACCCAPLLALLYGFLPAFVAQRRDALLTPGQGFAVAFIATGIGMLVWAVSNYLYTGGTVPAGYEEAIREALENQPDLPPEEREALVDMLIAVHPYVPVILTAVVSLIAAFVGLITSLIFRPRFPPDQAPPHTGDPTGV